MAETVLTPAALRTPASRPRRKGTPGHARQRSAAGLPALTLVASTGLAIWAQFLVEHGAGGGEVSAVFAAAAALFAFGLWGLGQTGVLAIPFASGTRPFAEAGDGIAAAQARARRRARELGISPLLASMALTFGLATFLASGGNRFTAFNVSTWIGSVVCALAACWQPALRLPQWRGTRARAARLRLPEAWTLRLSWHGLALAAVIALGVFLLYYRIADVPREMTSDHAEKLLDVRDVLDGQHRIFFPRNTGREAFQFYLIAIMTPLAGVSYLTMKLGTALLACFTIPLTYLFARVFFDKRLALLTTAILVMSRWHLQVARVGLRFPFPPLFGAAIMLFLLRAIRDRRRNDFLLCGLVLGIAQHTYTSLRLAPLMVLGCVGVALVADLWRREPPARVKALLVNTGLLAAVAFLVFVPLARYAYDDPRTFLFRGVTRIASDTENAVPAELWKVFLGNVKNAFLAFNWTGDLVWVNNISGERLLEPISGGLFVLGCTYALYRLIRHREMPYLYLFVLLFMGLLPSIMSLAYPIENPSTVRSGAAIPVVMVLVSLPIYVTARSLHQWLGERTGTVLASAGVAALLLFIFRDNFVQYYTIYPQQHEAASQHSSRVAAVVNGFVAMGGQRQDVHILPGAYWFDTRLVAIQAGDIRWNPLISNVDAARQQDGVPRPRLYIVKPDDQASLDLLAKWYPTSIRESHLVPEGGAQPWFVTVLVPPGAVAAR